MGLEKIKQEIAEKTAFKEKEILAEASSGAAEIRKKAEEQIRQLEVESAKSHEAQKKLLEIRESSLANLEAQKMLFEARKEILEKAYEEAFKKIKAMPKKDRESLIKKFLGKAAREIDIATVYANKEDAALIGKGYRVREAGLDGCIICETEDGRVRVDYTFGTLFRELRESTMQEASKILFG